MTNANAATAARDAAQPAVDLEAQTRYFFQSSADWLQTHWLQILIAVAIGTGIVLLLTFIRGRAVKAFQKRNNHITGWGSILAKAASKTNQFFIVMVAAKLVEGYAATPDAVTTTVNFLFTVAAVFQAAIWARELILGAVEKRTGNEGYHGETLNTAMGLIRLLVTIALFAIALVVVLDNLGVNVTGLVAGLGVGGIAIGLAAQGIFADLFAALSIIFDKPFRRGDSVSYDQTNGSIEAIGLKSTRIRSFTGEERVISNKQLLDKEITNNTQRDHRRGQFIIGVTYQTPSEVCAAIPEMLKAIVEQHEAIFIRCGFTSFGASSLDFELLFDTAGPDYALFYEKRTAIGIAILKRFNDDGIEIAYPTQTSFTAAPDGTMVLPYPDVQQVLPVEKGERVAKRDRSGKPVEGTA